MKLSLLKRSLPQPGHARLKKTTKLDSARPYPFTHPLGPDKIMPNGVRLKYRMENIPKQDRFDALKHVWESSISTSNHLQG